MKIARIIPGFLLSGLLLVACVSEPEPTPYSTPVPYQTTLFDVQVDATAGQERLNDPRPNIILILTDDQPNDTVQFMPTVRNILLKDGVNFENAFITTPLCCPSRSSILTGQYVHNHKVYTNKTPQGGAPKFDDTSTVAIWIQNAGYTTAYFGKYLNEYDLLDPAGYVPPGWNEWGAFLDKNIVADDNTGSSTFYENFSVSENGRIIEYAGEKTLFGADLVTQKAVDFIAENRDTPFFMVAGYYNPHSPYMWADRHNDQFRFNSALEAPPLYRPPNFLEEDMSDKPVYLQELSSIAAETVDVSYKQILRSLLSVDDGVASILNALEKTGLSDNTIIIYMTDNSIALGNHHLGLSKDCPYEECIRTPFIMYAPEIFPARNDPRIIANIDLAPTFVELAGGVVPASVDGMSFLPLLRDTSLSGREGILIEHWPTEDGIGSRIPEFQAVRTADWKYVEYSTGEKELYDLKNDPYELENLAGAPQYADLIAELRVKLEALKAQ